MTLEIQVVDAAVAFITAKEAYKEELGALLASAAYELIEHRRLLASGAVMGRSQNQCGFCGAEPVIANMGRPVCFRCSHDPRRRRQALGEELAVQISLLSEVAGKLVPSPTLQADVGEHVKRTLFEVLYELTEISKQIENT